MSASASPVLSGKNAVIYGAGGLGGGIAHAFAQAGARVFLASRRAEPLEALASSIRSGGGNVETAVLDVLDESAVDAHLRAVRDQAGAVDISFNLTSREDKQATPLVEMAVADFVRGPITALTAQFITARAAARVMLEQGSGVILSLTSGTAKAPSRGMGNTGSADAGVEVLMRTLALEVGASGVRVVGIHTAAVAETLTAEKIATVTGMDLDPQMVLESVAQGATLGRAPSLARVADTAVFLASDSAGDMTGTVVNVSCGMVPG